MVGNGTFDFVFVPEFVFHRRACEHIDIPFEEKAIAYGERAEPQRHEMIEGVVIEPRHPDPGTGPSFPWRRA